MVSRMSVSATVFKQIRCSQSAFETAALLTIHSENLIPFTRWITPHGPPKRFTTQMYLYMLPLASEASRPSGLPQTDLNQAIIPTPTHDGGVEHTAATFDDARAWLGRARAGDIILFPPQFYLLHLVSEFLRPQPSTPEGPPQQQREYYQAQRNALLEFLKRTPTSTSASAGPGAGGGLRQRQPRATYPGRTR